jgi:hypothetical protein
VRLDQLPVATVEEGRDRGALRLESEPGLRLPLGADAKVTDEFAVMFDQSVPLVRRHITFVLSLRKGYCTARSDAVAQLAAAIIADSL